MAAQNRDISGQNAGGGKDGQEQENVRVAALFAPRGQGKPQRAEGQSYFQTHQGRWTEKFEQTVKYKTGPPFVIDIFREGWREGEDIVAQKVSVLPNRRANGQFGPEIAFGDIMKRENAGERKQTQQHDQALSITRLAPGHGGDCGEVRANEQERMTMRMTNV